MHNPFMANHGLTLPFAAVVLGTHNLTRVQVKTSYQWRDYFEQNALTRLHVPWELGACVAEEEFTAIARSLQAWQLGETSDGSHLMAAATHYSLMMGDAAFVEAIRLFIKEEQRHGSDLGHFLDLAGVPRLKKDWGDAMFRRIRYFIPSMEVWATPVVMVETHALIYYAAIRRATKSPVLQKICEQVLCDEVPHIQFQCERLAILLRDRTRFWMKVTRVSHRIFFAGITLAIWAGHHRALKAGGHNLISFWKSSWAKMNLTFKKIEPGTYRWGATECTE